MVETKEESERDGRKTEKDRNGGKRGDEDGKSKREREHERERKGR